jgi:farnesyl diphosphate synthase
LRPLLVYASGSALGADEAALDAAACAVELIHAYSLVHDDLPAMDDDELRRGRPTVHVAFDEATAILAGDALQALAFEVLCKAPQADAAKLAMLRSLAEAAGAAGMCGGQAIDVDAVGQTLSLDALKAMHARKTGALIRAAVRLGGQRNAWQDRWQGCRGQQADLCHPARPRWCPLGTASRASTAARRTARPALRHLSASCAG